MIGVSTWSQLFCGHEYLRRFGGGRMWLECRICARRTYGIAPRPPQSAARTISTPQGGAGLAAQKVDHSPLGK